MFGKVYSKDTQSSFSVYQMGVSDHALDIHLNDVKEMKKTM